VALNMHRIKRASLDNVKIKQAIRMNVSRVKPAKNESWVVATLYMCTPFASVTSIG